MKNVKYLAVISVAALVTVFPLSAQKSDSGQRIRISASAMVVRGMAATASTFVDFDIKRLTTDPERDEFLKTLETGGQTALRRALEKADVGQVSSTGRVGLPIAFARAHPVEGGTLYNIVTARNMPYFELRNSGRSTDYPFSVAQILVENGGKKGQGQIILLASIRLKEGEDRITVESYGFDDTIRLTNIREKIK